MHCTPHFIGGPCLYTTISLYHTKTPVMESHSYHKHVHILFAVNREPVTRELSRMSVQLTQTTTVFIF